MGVAVVVTILNEEKTIGRLLNSLFAQTRNPDEVILIDAGSTDGTLEEISKFRNHNLRASKRLKVIIRSGISRAGGRNIGIRMAKNEMIALTDAGCVARKDWLEKLIGVLEREMNRGNKEVVVAGFYDMVARNSLQRATMVFLGVLPQDFSAKFLPSARSMAFCKRVWEKIGGFPEDLLETAEDTVFNFKAIQAQISFKRVKSARVEWGMPATISEFARKIFEYAKGDSRSKIIWNPVKGITSHNIKVIFVFIRYFVGSLVLVVGFLFFSPLLIIILVGFFIYCLYSFLKVFGRTRDLKGGVYGIILQIVSDFAVMRGFLSGVFC